LFAFVTLLVLQAGPTRSAEEQTDNELARKLETKISLAIEDNTPLADALGLLAAGHRVTIVLDQMAFEEARIAKVGDKPVSLKPVKDVTLGVVLQKLVEQVNGTYRVEKSSIIIEPKMKK
jgi:hypothetical protein